MQHHDIGNARGAHQCEVAKQRAAPRPAFDFVFHKVRARAFHHMNERQLVPDGGFLKAQNDVERLGTHRPGLDPGIVNQHSAARARDKTDPSNHRRAGHGFLFCLGVDHVAAQRVHLQPWHARVQKARQPFTRGDLAARLHPFAALFGYGNRPGFEAAEPVHQRQHVGTVLGKLVRAGHDAGLKSHHRPPSSEFTISPAGICTGWASRRWA